MRSTTFDNISSFLKDGYLPTESILVLKSREPASKLIVKEGNRRIAALKLILGLIDHNLVNIPSALKHRISELKKEWIIDNSEVPCIVYNPSEKDKVDRIVTLTHGKAEKAGRDQWNAVARARHNRDENARRETALDLLENYLENGQNFTPRQRARWAGDYPLTVLEEAIKKIAPSLGFRSAPELVKEYPSIANREALEDIIKNIGLKLLGFDTIRNDSTDFAAAYGIPGNEENSGSGNSESKSKRKGNSDRKGAKSGKSSAASSKNPSSVKALLRNFTPKGSGRGKVVLLSDEARKLNLKNNPLAFCFVLRSIFEISAKAYCSDHATTGGPSRNKANGKEKSLVEILRAITNYLTNNKADKPMVKKLHGAMTELGRTDGLLSVTSMNQLVHNESFAITTTDVCTVFGNVFPLLEAMNV